ncbi:MAG: GFA family protein [Hyphomicrobiaceae bacterium]
MSEMPKTLTGRCLCGAVRYEADAPFRPVSVCHCRQCAQWTGAFVMATSVAADRFRLVSGDASLGWYSASEIAKRGFCRNCGSSLFWKPNDATRISIMAGTLDPPTGLKLDHHIFVADKSDYYDILDGLPQEAQWSAMPKPPAGTS